MAFVVRSIPVSPMTWSGRASTSPALLARPGSVLPTKVYSCCRGGGSAVAERGSAGPDPQRQSEGSARCACAEGGARRPPAGPARGTKPADGQAGARILRLPPSPTRALQTQCRVPFSAAGSPSPAAPSELSVPHAEVGEAPVPSVGAVCFRRHDCVRDACGRSLSPEEGCARDACNPVGSSTVIADALASRGGRPLT